MWASALVLTLLPFSYAFEGKDLEEFTWFLLLGFSCEPRLALAVASVKQVYLNSIHSWYSWFVSPLPDLHHLGSCGLLLKLKGKPLVVHTSSGGLMGKGEEKGLFIALFHMCHEKPWLITMSKCGQCKVRSSLSLKWRITLKPSHNSNGCAVIKAGC